MCFEGRIISAILRAQPCPASYQHTFQRFHIIDCQRRLCLADFKKILFICHGINPFQFFYIKDFFLAMNHRVTIRA